MNVMLMTVRERTREIGIQILPALIKRHPAPVPDRVGAFTVVGGLLGAAAGLVAGGLMPLWDVPVIFSLPPCSGASGCAVVVTGLLFGYLPPARRRGWTRWWRWQE